MGRDQLFGGVSFPYLYITHEADALWEYLGKLKLYAIYKMIETGHTPVCVAQICRCNNYTRHFCLVFFT